MNEACKDNVVVLVVHNYIEDKLEQCLITLNPALVNDDVSLMRLPENGEQGVSIGAWFTEPRTVCYMGVDWRIQ